MATRAWYATREDVKGAGDSKETARNNAQVDRAIAASSYSIEEDLLHRRFYPTLATRKFDWPTHVNPDNGSRTLSLGPDELSSFTTLKVNGVTIDPVHITLLPANGPAPYSGVELDSTVTLTGSTGRRAIEITGTYDLENDEAIGTLAAGLAAGAAATANVSWTTAKFGVGDILRIDIERMIITDRTMVDSGQNLGAPGLTAQANNVTVPVTNGLGFAVGEIIFIDSERMLIVEIAGNNLTVKRAWDGSVLAAHLTNADIFTLTGVELARGQLGTVDASHLTSAVIYRHIVPPLVKQLCVAEATVALMQENSGYGRVIGSGDNQREAAGKGLEDLRARAYAAHGRKVF